jgi:hypothetical protein
MLLTPGILVLLGRGPSLVWAAEKAEAEVLAALLAEILAKGDGSPSRRDEGFTTSP